MALLHPHRRKLITLVALGCWLFAFFVGAVHACQLVGEFAGSPRAPAGAMDHHGHDDAVPAACEQHCVNDPPIPATVKLFEHQTGDQVFMLAPSSGASIVTGATPVTPLFDRLHPPPGIALYARFGRLTL